MIDMTINFILLSGLIIVSPKDLRESSRDFEIMLCRDLLKKRKTTTTKLEIGVSETWICPLNGICQRYVI